MLFTIMLTVGMAMALGVTVANVVKADIPADIGASTGLLTAAMVGALFLSRWAVGWFGLVYGKNMSSRLIHTGCCAPLLAIGAAPMLESQYYHDEGLSIWLGLVAVAVFANWQKTFDQAARSEMRFGGALWKALGALAMTGLAFAIITNDDVPDSPPPLLFASGGVALAAAIILQSASWLRPGTTARRRAGAVAAASPPNGVEDRYVDRDAGEATPAGDYPSGDLPFALPVGRSMPPAGHITATTDHAADVRHAFTRWGVTRAFWGVAAFVFMGGAIVTLLIAAILGHHDLNYGERTGVIVGGIACCAAMLFAVRKTTPIKREGFWQESIRPLLMCVSLFGMGATITGMARNWRWLSDDQQAFIVVGLIVSSLLFLASVLLCGRRRAEPKPFYNPPTGSGDVAGAGTPDTDETSSEDAGRNE